MHFDFQFKLIIISVLLIINSLISLFFYVNDSISGMIVFIIMSAIFFYASIRRIFKNRIVNDFILMFPVVFLAYTISYPLFRYVLNIISIDIRAVSISAILTGTLLSGLTINIYMILVLLFYKGKKVNFDKLGSVKISYRNIPFDIAALTILARYYLNFLSAGGFGLISSGISRLEATKFFNEGDFWIMKYFFICYSGYTLISIMNRKGFMNKYRIFNIIRLLNIIFFWGLNILIGNRRELLYLVLLLIFYITTKKDSILQVKHKIMIFVSTSFLLILGYFRTAFFSGEAINLEALILASFGDFFFPIQTLYHYIDFTPIYKLGATYFNVIPIFVPRGIWPDKPVSLAQQFVLDLNMKMGYAYTPITEGFVNFSYMTFIILPILIFLFFILVNEVSKYDSLLYVVVYMQLVNFNRGEFASSVMEILIMFFFIRIMYGLNNIKNTRSVIDENIANINYTRE